MNMLLRGDHIIQSAIRKFGGWPRILDPAYEVEEEVYACIEAAGYTRADLDGLRKSFGKPEREAWIDEIAKSFYWWWRKSSETAFFIGDVPGDTSTVRWQDYPNSTCWAIFSEPMSRLIISRDDIDHCIDSDPANFPPLKKAI
ncbi:MAG: hypothetical protein ACRD3W_12685 [Terriglobales bacterium]